MYGGAQVLQLSEYLPVEEMRAISRRLMKSPEVEYAEPDLILQPTLIPNDPQFREQWHYYGDWGINMLLHGILQLGQARLLSL